MDRKYYYAFYSYGVNVEGEPAILNIMTVSSYPTVIRSYLVKDYKNEKYNVSEITKGLFGKKIEKKIEKAKVVPESYFPLFVEEIDGKYYDIITGTEVICIGNFSDVPFDTRYVKFDVDSEILKTGKIVAYMTEKAPEPKVYDFVKDLTEDDIKLYIQRYNKLEEASREFSARLLKAKMEEEEKQRTQKEFMDKFSEKYGYQRKKKF